MASPSNTNDLNVISVGKLKHLNIFYSHATNSTPINGNNNNNNTRPADIGPRGITPSDRTATMNNNNGREVQAIHYHARGASIRLLNNNNNAHLRQRSLTPQGMSPTPPSVQVNSRPGSAGVRPPSAPLMHVNGAISPITCMPSTSGMNTGRSLNNGMDDNSYSNRPYTVMLNGPGTRPRAVAPPPSHPMGVSSHPPPRPPGPPNPSQANQEQMVKKCANFFSTLIKLSKQKADATKVVNLVQRVINGTLTPGDFTGELQKELQSAAQPNLLPFLEKALPHLRRSLAFGTLTIEEIEPPRLAQSPKNLPTYSVSAPSATAMAPPSPYRSPQINLINRPPSSRTSLSTPIMVNNQSLQRPPMPSNSTLERFREGDDDLNDVTAMGGVNIPEELQRLASTDELLQCDTRPLPPGSDRVIPKSSVVLSRLRQRLAAVHITDVHSQVSNLIAHALQHRLKDIIERLAVVSEHRMECFRGNPAYVQMDDTRLEVRAIEETERGQLQRREDREKEYLYKMSKSRSTNLESDQQERLRLKAKEMQKAEQEELRNREANQAAAIALGGGRKRTWADSVNDSEDVFDRPVVAQGRPGFTTSVRRPRVKRVNMKDLHFLMAEDRETRSSTALYRTIFSTNKHS